MLTFLNEEIQDKVLNIILSKLFKSQVLEENISFIGSSCISQVNLLIPLLSNIYFNKLDQEIQQIIKRYKMGMFVIRTVVYKKTKLEEEKKMIRLS